MGVKISNTYYNTELPKCKFILANHGNSIALIDTNKCEGLTDFIEVKNRHAITKREWCQICNGCPEYFYSNVPNDIKFKSPLDELTLDELQSLTESFASHLNKYSVPLDRAKTIQKILDSESLKQTTELVNYLDGL